MNKEKACNIARIVFFVLFFILLIETVSVLFFNEETATKYRHGMRDAYSFVNDRDNSLQIIFVGNSDLYSGISPLDLWRYQGFTSTVCASPNQTIGDSTSIIETFLKFQKPDLVVIEVDMLYVGKGKKRNNSFFRIKDLDYYFDRCDPDLMDNAIQDYCSIFRFHNYWKGGKTNKNKPYNLHGYKYTKKVVPLRGFNYMKYTDKTDPIKRITEEQTDKLIKLSRENGAEVVLLELPSINSWNYKRHNAMQQYADKRKINFVDMNMNIDEIGIDWGTCFRDKSGSHLNYKGAKAATKYLGKYIADNYYLKSHTGDERYSDWDEDLEMFDFYKKNNKQKQSWGDRPDKE